MDGIHAGKNLYSSVCLMIESAGYIILVSGSTLCVSFLGTSSLPPFFPPHTHASLFPSPFPSLSLPPPHTHPPPPPSLPSPPPFLLLGLIFLPMEILRSLGLAASVTILTALLVNLSLTPSLLLVLGPALLRADEWVNAWVSRGRCWKRGGEGGGEGGREGAMGVPLLEEKEKKVEGGKEGGKKKEAVEKDEVDEGYECDESEPLRKGCWLRLAR